ncbi:MAG: SDR family oxidoreductase [Pedosphaera sp.]|nr:SDR family oxidoreductase [Pedosphaera sp.]
MRVLIIGCGYVGTALGERLVRCGHTVFGLRRSIAGAADLSAAGIHPLTGDVTRPGDLATLPDSLDWVVNTVSSSRGGPTEYRDVYREGTCSLIAALSSVDIHRFAYTSSTSVYGQMTGGWVDESAPAKPAGETGRLLIETEQLLLSAVSARQFPAVILRVAGIYGPSRGSLFQKYLRGEARLDGDGLRWLNMIHRDDVASALHAALEFGQPGEIYNATDDEPVSQLDFFRWLDSQLKRGIPPTAGESETTGRKRGVTNKRVSNRKLSALGWRPAFPTFREGYAAAVGVAQKLAHEENRPSSKPGRLSLLD